jgi:hypothetical protein
VVPERIQVLRGGTAWAKTQPFAIFCLVWQVNGGMPRTIEKRIVDEIKALADKGYYSTSDLKDISRVLAFRLGSCLSHLG